MAATRLGSHPSRSFRGRRVVLGALVVAALVLWLPTAQEKRLLAAVALTSVTPYGASAGVTVQITGTGFDPTAANNSVTLTPSSGAPVTVVADSIATLDPVKGLRRIGIKVPAGLAIGPAAVRVVNTVTGESASGASLQIIAISLPAAQSGTRGAQNLTVRVNGTSNVQFVAGRTTVTFGAGVTVTSTQVLSPTSLDATVSISSTTPLGARTITVVSSTQTAQLTGAFAVTAATADAPPTANAGPDQTVAVGSTVTLNATGSTDPEGHALTYAWAFASRPADSQATLSNATAVMPTFGVDRAGTYEVQLVVSDGALSSLADTVRISTQNSRPISNAGPDQTSIVASTVHLDGHASSDPDGDTLTFAWSFVSVPAGSTTTLSGAAAVNPAFVVDRFGSYVLQLVVSDGTLSSVADTVSISTLNSSPVAAAGPDQTSLVGNTVTLNGNGSSDVDGNPLTFSWSFTSRPTSSFAALSDPKSVSPNFAVDAPGTYVLQLIVNDGQSDSAPDTLTVTTLNSGPVANAGPDQAVARGDVAHLTGSASTDVDGNALTYSWSLTTRPTGSAAVLSNPAIVNPTFVADRSGTYIAQLVVNDGTVDSAPDVVNIGTQNQPPVANAGANQTVAAGAAVQLDGTASSDPNGDAITFRWSLLSKPQGSTAELSNALIVNPTFVVDQLGDYVAQLIVNDGEVDGAPATVTISTLNSRPSANAGPDQTVITTSTVELNAKASSDPDGTPLLYSWSILSRPSDSTATLSNLAIVNPTFVADLAGLYVAQLIVNDGVLSSDPDTVAIQVGDGADLRIQFSTVPDGAAVGSNVNASVQVINDGPSSTSNVTAHFQLPAGYTLTGGDTDLGSTPGPVSYDVATGDWTISEMPTGTFADLTLTATVNATGPYDLAARITGSSQPDPDLANNTATETITPNPNADLRIQFAGPPTIVIVGSAVGLHVQVINDGPASTNNVAAHFQLPAGYTLTGGNTDRGSTPGPVSYDFATGDWTISAMPAGTFADLTLTATVNATGPYDVAARITGSGQPDSNPANNTATQTITSNSNADLRIQFANPPTTLIVGSAVSLHVQVINDGPASTNNVAAHFQLPAGYTLTGGQTDRGSTPGPVSYDFATGDLTISAMPTGTFADLTLTATVNATGPYNLTAAITSSSQPDTNPANNIATAIVTLANRAPLANAGPDQTGSTNAAVFLDGRGSSDPDGDAITFHWVLTVRPANSAAVLSNATSATPSFVPDLVGRYDVQLTATDSHGVSVTDMVTITAALGKQPPVITSAPVTVAAAGQPYRYEVKAKDPDAGDVLAFALAAPPTGMTIDQVTGTIAWTPTEAQGGPQHVEVRVQDQHGLFATQGFAVQVSSAANHAPVANDDAAEVRVNEGLSIGAPGVLGNDTDSDGHPLTATLLTQPANGTLNLNADGAYTYTPHSLRADDLVQLTNMNLASRVPGTVAHASSNAFAPAPSAFDDSLATSWRTGGFDNPTFIEMTFPVDATINELQILGHRDPFLVSQNLGATTGFFQLFDSAGTERFNSGVIDLPLPNHDVRQIVPTISGIRRARFTVTSSNEAGFAEFRVMGSALVRRVGIVEPDLTHLLATTVTASSFVEGNRPEGAIDDTPATNWYANGTAGEFLDLAFPVDVTVTELRTANPSGRPDFFGTSLPINCSGKFVLLDAAGGTLFDSGVVNEPSGNVNQSDTFALAIPAISSVRHVRYTSSGCTGAFPPGFSSIAVIGSAPVTTPAFSVARKFQGLVGREVHSTPIVAALADTNDDGRIDLRDTPSIVVPVENASNQIIGDLKVISGLDGHELFTAGTPGMISPWSETAVGDLDGDSIPEILGIHADGQHVVAFDNHGVVKWTSDASPMPTFPLGPGIVTGAIAIANLNGGPHPHVIVGATVFDSTGHLIGDGRALGGTTGGIGLRSAISAVADIDLDGTPEIVAGPTAYHLSNGALTKVWQRTDRIDGYAAIGNFDDDPQAEIVIVANGFVYMLEHDGSDAAVWNPGAAHAPIAIPGSGQGGAPTIADLDGDGIAEIGVAAATQYVVFNRDGTFKWRVAISDRSSNATGATVFDLDDDGDVEVIYRDEVNLRILNGADGTLLAKTPIGSSTWSEMPVVADVDNDGHADIIVSSDAFLESTVASTGLHVLEDVGNKWARTRRIWNQHSYHVTNVNEDGTIPRVEQPHWLVPGLNNFRLNAFFPGVDADREDRFTYKASDGTLESNVATVRIAIRTPNSPPEFTSTPVTLAATSVSYQYAAQASDPDHGDVFTFSLPKAPTGMTIDPDFGLIEWTPAAGQLGIHDVVVRVRDTHGAVALQSFKVEVSSPLTVPIVVGQVRDAATAAIAGAGFAVGTVATQSHPVAAEGTVFSQSPSGGSLAPPGALVSIIVSLGRAVGDTDSDHDGFTANQGDCDDGSASVHPGATDIPGNGIDEDCSGADAINPGTLDADHDGFTPIQGDCNDLNADINPGAVDVPGNGVDENCNGADSVAGDGDFPTASISSPADGAVVTMPTDIVGTASDAHLLRYRVELSEVDATTSTVIGTGATSVVNGVLGRLDPTLLENGLYRVRMVAEDVNGEVTTNERVYRITGEMKVGVFALSFIDLQVPVAGIPITLIRSYDSRVKTQRDFGTGWTLQVKNGSYRSNRPPGQGWIIKDQPFIGGSLPCVGGTQETRSHVTEIRLSDREAFTFALTVTGANLGITGACEGTASFRFIDGTSSGATLEILDGTSVLYLRGGSDEVLDLPAFLDGTSRVYDPRRVRLTTREGQTVTLDRFAGITNIEDNNGNSLSITPGGIVHSSGRSIAFTRDAVGRLTRITDSNGRQLSYGYDARGDLIEFIDLAGNRTTFSYDTRHNLLEIHDPLGNRAVRSEYDADGRLVAVIDAAGNRLELTHDITDHREIIRDRRGYVTIHTYDETGHVTSTVDALGKTTSYTYDARGNKLSITDALGHTRRLTYDAGGDLLTQSDPLGNVFAFAYDSSGRIVSVTDPGGFRITSTFDSNGNLTSSENSLGALTRFAYDGTGNLTRATDPLGHSIDTQYDASGNPVSQRDRLGHASAFTYDAAGNQLTQSSSRMDERGHTVSVSLRLAFNPYGRLLGATDPEGGGIGFTYDGNGRQTQTRDRKGHAVQQEFDSRGNRARTIYPDGTSEGATYDPNGNRDSATDRLGRTSRFEYDALNRLTRTTFPDGSTEQTEYDAVGRIAAKIDETGGRTEYTYDAAGRRTAILDALGGRTTFEYDSRGNLTRFTDSNGHAKTFDYDANKQLTRTTFADGTSQTFSYDDEGRKIAVTDPEGKVTRFEYDAAGRLVKVIDALGGQTLYGYDELGNRTSVTDANGHVSRWAYDNLHRVVSRTLPLGMAETFDYDRNGNVETRKDFLGRATTYTFDVDGLPVTKTHADGRQVRYTYTDDNKIERMTDSRGDTRYAYDNHDRVIQITEPTGETIHYGYDVRGNRTSVEIPSGTTRYAYDPLNRLTQVTDAAGGTTRYVYDAAGNRIRCEYPNRTLTDYAYDANNRLVSLRNHRADGSIISSYSYTLGSLGERLSAVESSGRRVDYSYDSLYRLLRESITDPVNGNEILKYTYDAVGNRLGKVSSSGTTSYSYDANDRLLSDGVTTYQYDFNGNAVLETDGVHTTTSVYDFEDRLIARLSNSATMTYAYDGQGVRVASNLNGVETRYLVDRQAPFSRVLEERDGGGALRVRYEYGDNLLSQWRNGVAAYYLYDGLGSTRTLTDAPGAATDAYTYDAFGVLLQSTGSTPNNYLFAGQESDGSVGLYYLRARYYRPEIGRFLTADVILDTTGDPATLHKYTYCSRFTANCIDPSGHSSLIEELTVVAVVGILATTAVAGVTVGQVLYYLSGSHAFVPLTQPDAAIVGIVADVSLSALIRNSGTTNPWWESIALGLQFVSGIGGFEYLHTTYNADQWFYAYLGGLYSVSTSYPVSASITDRSLVQLGIYLGATWNVKKYEDYEKTFLSIGGSRLMEMFPALPRTGTVFTGDSYGAAYGFSVGATFDFHTPNKDFNLSAARTYYWFLNNAIREARDTILNLAGFGRDY